jgi:hypothetical protein
MIRFGKWMFATAVLTGVVMFSLPGAACTKTIGGKAASVGGAFVCDCTNGGSGCGCTIEDPTCGGGHAALQD